MPPTRPAIARQDHMGGRRPNCRTAGSRIAKPLTPINDSSATLSLAKIEQEEVSAIAAELATSFNVTKSLVYFGFDIGPEQGFGLCFAPSFLSWIVQNDFRLSFDGFVQPNA